MDYRTVFGINLKRLSKEAKVNYEQVGMAVNRKSGTVQAWVSGRSDPEIGILPKLADFFSKKIGRWISLDEFFDRRLESN